MAKVGNHGIIIPRNKRLLHRLYWTENRSLVEVAAIFGVTHKSLSKVMHKLGIPIRPRRTAGQSRWRSCVDCGDPVVKIKHPINGAFYGRRCKECQRAHKRKLQFAYTQRPEIRAKRNELNHRAYFYGPVNLAGEKQWLSRSKVLLRNVKRVCQSQNPAHWRFRSEAFTPEQILRG